MIKSLLAKSLLFTGVMAFAASSSWATLVAWDFNPNNLNQAVGSPTTTFTSSGVNLSVTGYDHQSAGVDTLHQLYFKNEPIEEGATERGLGMVNTNANELNINPDGSVGQYLQLDLRALLAQGFTAGQIAVASMQNGEGFRLFGSNTQGVLGTQLPGTWTGLTFDDQFVAVPNFGQYQFLSIAANSGRVLPVAFELVTPVPEMSALLPIVGLVAALGFTHMLRRRAARAQSFLC